jgi:G3E family GTPase
MADTDDKDKTPVTLITGFLGSGKTTLVNYILKEQKEWKICVVENEFGEIPIDNDLVEENLAAKEDIITMDNGCVCCSIRGDLVRTFGMLVARRKQFDAIIIETTGLADPSPIIFTFNSNSNLQENYRLDSVVCLVDAKHIGIHLDEKKPDGNINEAENQVAFADRIILNKLDLVSSEELSDLEERIREINSFAHLIKTERSRVPLDQILNLNSFSLEKLVEVDPTLMDDEVPEEEEDHGHSHSHEHGESCSMNHNHDEHCSAGDHDHHDHNESCHHDHHDHHQGDSSSCTQDHDHNDHCHDHHHNENEGKGEFSISLVNQ